MKWLIKGTQIDSSQLYTKDNLLAQLKIAPNYRHMQNLMSLIAITMGTNLELYWEYHICDGEYLGAYIVPVQEGFLRLPYHEITRDQDETFDLDGARLLTSSDCEFFTDEMTRAYMVSMTVLQDMAKIIQGQNADPNKDIQPTDAELEIDIRSHLATMLPTYHSEVPSHIIFGIMNDVKETSDWEDGHRYTTSDIRISTERILGSALDIWHLTGLIPDPQSQG